MWPKQENPPKANINLELFQEGSALKVFRSVKSFINMKFFVGGRFSGSSGILFKPRVECLSFQVWNAIRTTTAFKNNCEKPRPLFP